MQHKSQCPSLIAKFLSMVHNQFEVIFKVVKSDNGREFLNIQCENLFIEKRIVYQTSCPYTPQQNGVVERKYKHILEVAKTFRFHAQLPKKIMI